MIFDLLIFFFSIDHANPLLLCLLLSFFLHDHFCSLSINGYTLAPYAHLKMSCRVMRRSKSRISIFKSKNTLIIHVECWWNAQRKKTHISYSSFTKHTHNLFKCTYMCGSVGMCMRVRMCVRVCVCVAGLCLYLQHSTFNKHQRKSIHASRLKRLHHLYDF